MPGELAAAEREILVEPAADGRDDAGRSVAPLRPDQLCPSVSQRLVGDRWPVDQAVLGDRVPAQDVRNALAVGEREHTACEAVRRPDVPPLMAVEVLRPEPVRCALRAKPVDCFVDVEPELAADEDRAGAAPHQFLLLGLGIRVDQLDEPLQVLR